MHAETSRANKKANDSSTISTLIQYNTSTTQSCQPTLLNQTPQNPAHYPREPHQRPIQGLYYTSHANNSKTTHSITQLQPNLWSIMIRWQPHAQCVAHTHTRTHTVRLTYTHTLGNRDCVFTRSGPMIIGTCTVG
jgi:hypothetical protein